MHTVNGPTDHVVIVGAGLAGLSAALRLAGAGRTVTVLEREAVPGGRAGVLDDGGYRFDTGPTVLTMPELIEDCLACVGENLSDWLPLTPLDPLYRANFADGSRLDVRAGPDAMAAEIRRVCGPREADGYRRFLAFATRLYRCEMTDFIDHNTDSPFGLLRPSLAKLVALGGFRKLAAKIATFLRDERTQRIFTFQAMYAGVSPFQALALYAVISYMDTVSGVYFPAGGMHALPVALAAAAEKHGVTFRYETEVARVELTGGRATGVLTTGGERVAADVVVLNPDLPAAYRDLLGREPRKLRYSPSCFVLHAGSATGYPDLVHHNIHFGAAWRETFDELLRHGRLMSDPSFLLTSPTVSDPNLAPAGRHTYYCLLPTPNLTAGIDWQPLGPVFADQVVDMLEAKGYPGFRAGIEVQHTTTPLDWAAAGMAAGTPFAAAHTFGQTGPFRPGNLYGENVVFTGSGTRPGVGVPMVLISGRLAAERILGRT